MVRLAHLGTAMVTLALLTAGAIRGLDVRGGAYPGVRVSTGLLLAAALVVLMGGSIVGANLSGACPGLPLCGGDSPTDAAWFHGLHRTASTLFLIALIATSVWLVKRRGSRLAIGLSHGAALLVILQIGVGVSTVTLSLPTGLRVLHLGMATLIWWAVVAQWVLALKGRSD
jgi:heme A synthase